MIFADVHSELSGAFREGSRQTQRDDLAGLGTTSRTAVKSTPRPLAPSWLMRCAPHFRGNEAASSAPRGRGSRVLRWWRREATRRCGNGGTLALEEHDVVAALAREIAAEVPAGPPPATAKSKSYRGETFMRSTLPSCAESPNEEIFALLGSLSRGPRPHLARLVAAAVRADAGVARFVGEVILVLPAVGRADRHLLIELLVGAVAAER